MDRRSSNVIVRNIAESVADDPSSSLIVDVPNSPVSVHCKSVLAKKKITKIENRHITCGLFAIPGAIHFPLRISFTRFIASNNFF